MLICVLFAFGINKFCHDAAHLLRLMDNIAHDKIKTTFVLAAIEGNIYEIHFILLTFIEV